jgi:hypothetical protein
MLPAILSLIEAAITSLPSLVVDVENLIAELKNNNPAVAQASLAAKVTAETQPLVDQLQGK